MLTVDSEIDVLGEVKDLLRCDLCEREETRQSYDQDRLDEDRKKVVADGGQLKLGQSQARLDVVDDVQEESDEDLEDESDPIRPNQVERSIHARYGDEYTPDECVAGRDDCAGARSLPWGWLPCIECFVLCEQELIDDYNQAKPPSRPHLNAPKHECRSYGELSSDPYRCSECGVDLAGGSA
jgi:hypothetical protein